MKLSSRSLCMEWVLCFFGGLEIPLYQLCLDFSLAKIIVDLSYPMRFFSDPHIKLLQFGEHAFICTHQACMNYEGRFKNNLLFVQVVLVSDSLCLSIFFYLWMWTWMHHQNSRWAGGACPKLLPDSMQLLIWPWKSRWILVQLSLFDCCFFSVNIKVPNLTFSSLSCIDT